MSTSPASIRSTIVGSPPGPGPWEADRKSTRLNSSHVAISYAVFCLKKIKAASKVKITICSIRNGYDSFFLNAYRSNDVRDDALLSLKFKGFDTYFSGRIGDRL